jgi:hypothetical protein
MIDRADLKELQKKIKTIGLTDPKAAEVDRLLDMSELDLLQLQFDAAMKDENLERAVEKAIKIKKLESTKNKFAFEKVPVLKRPEMFAEGATKGRKKKLMKDMLIWTWDPIPGSMTKIQGPDVNKLSRHLHKDIMGWMGDRALSYTPQLAREVLKYGCREPFLRDEIYCQLIKQLRDNRSSRRKRSEKRGWALMMLCLQTFPASDTMGPYLEMFLVQRGQDAMVKVYYESKFNGATENPPGIDEIDGASRTYYNLSKAFNTKPGASSRVRKESPRRKGSSSGSGKSARKHKH